MRSYIKRAPTLDQVIRDFVKVQERLLREAGAEIHITLSFCPATKPKKRGTRDKP